MVTKIQTALATQPAGITELRVGDKVVKYSPEELRRAYEFWSQQAAVEAGTITSPFQTTKISLTEAT